VIAASDQELVLKWLAVDPECEISVTVPTRGRPQHIQECISSILACRGPSFEVFVVDQSDDHATEQAVSVFLADGRFRYRRTDTRGVCAARNVGIRESRGNILVCTDDDCRAEADWLEQLAATFARNPQAAVACGQVFVSEEMSRTGYAVSYAADAGELTIDSMRRGVFPLTANLAFRRETVESVGMFDEALGSGGPLRSGGEPDFLLRVLRSGRHIVDAPNARVTHLGVRIGAAADALMQKYLFGTGAALAKHIRLGDVWGLDLLARYLRLFCGQAARNLLRTGRPRGLANAASLTVGALASLRFRVDSKSRLYRLPQ
jgi:glycosyltransferase involved in cell wall biosynthesis